MTSDFEAIDQLFEKIKNICPAWTQAWPTDERELGAKRAWLDAFQLEGIHTQDQLNRGLKALYNAKTEFVPAPGKFVDMCKPTRTELGIPTDDQAYLEAAKNSHIHSDKNWSHSAVKYAAQEVGKDIFRNLSAARSRDKFLEAYKKAVNMAVTGTLPTLTLIGTPEEKKPVNRTSCSSKLTGEGAIAEIKAMLAGKPSKHKRCVETLLRPIAVQFKTTIEEIQAKLLSKEDLRDIQDGKVSFSELRVIVGQWVKDGRPYSL